MGEAGGGDPAEVSALLAGLSSLLHLGLHLAFFPESGNGRPDDGDFTGAASFVVLGWTADEHGERVQLASEPVTGATPIQAPDGWAGRTELDQLELVATVVALGTPGEWRAIAVVEPADGGMCEEIFAALVAEVSLTVGVKARLEGVP